MKNPFITFSNTIFYQNSGTIFDSITKRIDNDLSLLDDSWSCPSITDSSSGILLFDNCQFINNDIDDDINVNYLFNLQFHSLLFEECTFNDYICLSSSELLDGMDVFEDGCMVLIDTALSVNSCEFNNNKGSFIISVSRSGNSLTDLSDGLDTCFTSSSAQNDIGYTFMYFYDQSEYDLITFNNSNMSSSSLD